MKRYRKLKIKGITGTPLFLTRFQGYFDGKRGAVERFDDGWHSHYIENKRAIYDGFVHQLYAVLESQTSALHQESAELVMEYKAAQEKLSRPDEAPTGATSAIRTRNSGRAAAERSQLQVRQEEIELRLSAIDEAIAHAVSEAASNHREATALTSRRVQAYLHGAALAAHAVNNSTAVDIHHSFEEEKDYISRHSLNEMRRHSVIEEALKEVNMS